MADERANVQTQIIERDLSKLGERFDRHLEIYATNGKELAALKQSVDGLHHTFERHFSNNNVDQKKQWEKIETNEKDIADIHVSLARSATMLAVYASIGAAVGSTLLGLLINKLFL